MPRCKTNQEVSEITGNCVKKCQSHQLRDETTGRCKNTPVQALQLAPGTTVKNRNKQMKFNKVLQSAKRALDSIGIRFHLHAGTALGAHRERSFIPYDHDIDLAVFYDDVHTRPQVNEMTKAMRKEGFSVDERLGKLDRGYEIQFEKDGVPLDIFWVYHGEYRGKEYHVVSSYFGKCDTYKHKACVWGYRVYDVKPMTFLGEIYDTVPVKTIVDMYGKDWKIVKKYSYEDSIDQGHAKGLIKDYYNPRDLGNNIAFCFMLYDQVKHNSVWQKFFGGEQGEYKSWSVYTHLKTKTDKTQKWVKDAAIRSIKTEWCENSLVDAWLKLLSEALKDPNNQYFIILSGDCIPLQDYDTTYKAITSDKRSRFNIDVNAEVTEETGLVYADQWSIVNRKHAEMLLELKTTQAGKDA